MAFSETLQLDGRSGILADFVTIKTNDPSVTRRINTSTTPTEPGYLDIKHDVQGSGSTARDRHNVVASLTKADNGVPQRASVSLTLTVPRSSVITQNDLDDLVSYVVDLITSGGFGDSGLVANTNLVKLARGES